MKTTLGQLLVNEALPEEYRDYSRVWDKKTTAAVLRDIAQKHPDKYVDVSKKLLDVGQMGATTGNFSFSLKDFLPSKYKQTRVRYLREKVQDIIDDNKLSLEDKNKKIILLLGKETGAMEKNVLDEAAANGNRLAELVKGGSKGSPTQFNTTVGAPLMFLDHRDEPIPIPVFNSVSEGMTPAEYWAASYGTRKGTISTKFATREAGYFGKKLALAAHRAVVTEDDCGTNNGIAVDGDDPENVGTVLQLPVGGIKAGTVIRPEHLKALKNKKILVRSPITCQAEGLCSKCSGIRERGTFPEVGDNVGLSAAMSVSERISQTMLNVKHQGGAASGKKAYTFQDIEHLFEMPKHNRGLATVADTDGTVKDIKPAPAGGYFVVIGDHEHWIPDLESAKVKKGDIVEAGDVLSAGIPNFRDVAKYKGIGEARNQFVGSLREVAGNSANRRNAEVIARSMIKHVHVNDRGGPDGTLPGDVISYDDIVRNYTPRETSAMTSLSKAHNKYLDQPVVHYSIGTRITPRVYKTMQELGVSNVLVNDKPPVFEPDVKRMYEHSQFDPDWMTRLGGYDLKDRLLEGVAKGDTSITPSTSYIPSTARGSIGEEISTKGKY